MSKGLRRDSLLPRGAKVLVMLAALTLVSLNCAEQCRQPSPLLVLYAFSEEGALLREVMTLNTTYQVCGRTVSLGTLSGKKIVLAESGIGLINAAMTTQRLIDRYAPRAIVFTGIAGAIDTTVHIGDIVVCRTWSVHDYGYLGSEGLTPRGTGVYIPGVDSIARVESFAADSGFLATAESLNDGQLDLQAIGDRMPRLIVGGMGVSGNTFIDNLEKRVWLSTTFAALVTDMESAAVAQVASVNDIPFIIFRSASDLAGGSGTESASGEMDEFWKIAATNSATMLQRFLVRL